MNVKVTHTVSGTKICSATYVGTNIARFWRDPFLKKALVDAINLAGTDKDAFDYCNFLFSSVDNAVRRRYGGRELTLDSVVIDDGNFTVTSFQ